MRAADEPCARIPAGWRGRRPLPEILSKSVAPAELLGDVRYMALFHTCRWSLKWKLPFVDGVAAVTGLYERKHAGQFQETRFRPQPSKYLRDRQWEDPIRYSADNEPQKPFVHPVMAEYLRADAETRARRAEREAKREIDDAAFRARGGGGSVA